MRLAIFVFILLISAVAVDAESIGGHVIDSQSRTGLVSVSIEVSIEAQGFVDTVWTDADGMWQYSLPPTSVHVNPALPATPELWANYPNPFKPSTTISFYLPAEIKVRILVYNTLGQEVGQKESFLPSGAYQIDWRAQGAAGVYFYVLQCGDRLYKGKMIQLEAGQAGGLAHFIPAKQAAHSLSRSTATGREVRLIMSKFTYWPDTTKIIAEENPFTITTLQTVHDHAILADLHNDILERMQTDTTYHLGSLHTRWHTDIPRLRRGGMDLQFIVLWVDPVAYANAFFQTSLQMIQMMKREESYNPSDFQQITSIDALASVLEENRIAYIFGVEGGHTIENDLDKLYQLYHLGMRYLTITWNNSTSWAVSASDSHTNSVGLSDFGKTVVRACDSLGVLIDVSHVGRKTIQDILATSHNPIIATHSGARALRDHSRNLDDNQILAIAQRGGIIGVVFYPSFLVSYGQKASIATVIAHIDYIVKLAGIDCVALGSDYDGFEGSAPVGLEDTSCYPALTTALLQKGYTPQEVEKILGGNVLRVLGQVCKIRATS